ncbi:hypothetical protein EON65_06990, partial [archaeon]
MSHILFFSCFLYLFFFISTPSCICEERLVISPTSSSLSCAVLDGYGKVLPHKVLLFLDNNFFSLFRNWIVYYKKICTGPHYINQLELVCLDDQVELKLSNLSLYCSRNETDVMSSSSHNETEIGDRQSLVWLKRLEIIHSMLNAGTNLILSDTDAFWLKNPYPELNQHASTSLIVSSRGWFPFSISRV